MELVFHPPNLINTAHAYTAPIRLCNIGIRNLSPTLVSTIDSKTIDV